MTRNTLGGRGIEVISAPASSTTTVAYPLYDGHGNMVATLAKNGSGGYTPGNWRTYDVWGSVRSGSATGDPTKRYCASIGHQADDESDLIYMRARYYEPSSGRFVSEDSARDGNNWYSYCGNQPVTRYDPTGHSLLPDVLSGAMDEVEAQLESYQFAQGLKQRMLSQFERACYHWAEKWGALVEDMGWYGEQNMIGVAGRLNIQFHITEDLLAPHTVPHIQLAIVGRGTIEWFFYNPITQAFEYAASGWGVP